MIVLIDSTDLRSGDTLINAEQFWRGTVTDIRCEHEQVTATVHVIASGSTAARPGATIDAMIAHERVMVVRSDAEASA